MKDKIEAKVNEVIEYIISKNPEDITYNEYRILDNRLASLKYEKDQKERDEMMAALTGSLFKCSSIPPSHSLDGFNG